MASKPATVTVNHRELTKALVIAKALDAALGSDRLDDHRDETRELVRLLDAFDLRSGKNDPTKPVTKKSAKRSTKRSAKKAKTAGARR